MTKKMLLIMLMAVMSISLVFTGCMSDDSDDNDNNDTDGDTDDPAEEDGDTDDPANEDGDTDEPATGCDGACDGTVPSKCEGDDVCVCEGGTWKLYDCGDVCEANGQTATGCGDDGGQDWCLCDTACEGECCSDEDCDQEGYVCDLNTNTCVEDEPVECPANSHSDGSGGCVCDDGYCLEGGACVVCETCEYEGVCIGYANSDVTECLQECTHAEHSCAENHMCIAYLGIDDNNMPLAMGYCNILAQTQEEYDAWIAAKDTCTPTETDPNGGCPAGFTCLGDGTNNWCFEDCPMQSDVCQSATYPGLEQAGPVPLGCVGNPMSDGSTMGLCDPWPGLTIPSCEANPCDPCLE